MDATEAIFWIDQVCIIREKFIFLNDIQLVDLRLIVFHSFNFRILLFNSCFYKISQETESEEGSFRPVAMFYEKEKIDRLLCCSLCDHKFSDVVKLIPECVNSICGECHDGLRDELENLPAQYTCKACGEDGHLMPAKGLANIKIVMDLVKTTPTERPLSEQAKKLRELVGRVDEEMKRLDSFDPDQYIREHFDQLEDEVNEAADSAVKHINEIRGGLLRENQERRQECQDSLYASFSGQLKASREQSSKLQLEIAKLSMYKSKFVLKWKSYFQRADSYASDQEIATALDQAQDVLDEIEKCDQASKLEATNRRSIQFEANNLFVQTKDHLGKLAVNPFKEDKYQGLRRGEDTQARRNF